MKVVTTERENEYLTHLAPKDILQLPLILLLKLMMSFLLQVKVCKLLLRSNHESFKNANCCVLDKPKSAVEYLNELQRGAFLFLLTHRLPQACSFFTLGSCAQRHYYRLT